MSGAGRVAAYYGGMPSVSPPHVRACTACGGLKPLSDFHARATQCKPCRKGRMAAYYVEHRSRINGQNVRAFNAVRESVLTSLGARCASCGEAEPEFLSVDHLNNDRKSERSSSSLTWKRDIASGRADPSRYQVLCRNCNESKQRLNPVQLIRAKETVGELKACTSCLLKKDLGEFYKSGPTRRHECNICFRFRLLTVTMACYELLGGKCTCCGIDNPSMLNVDHRFNDGNVRRANGERTGVGICRQILRGTVDKSDFQLLCSNCNYSKMLSGRCHHSRALNGFGSRR